MTDKILTFWVIKVWWNAVFQKHMNEVAVSSVQHSPMHAEWYSLFYLESEGLVSVRFQQRDDNKLIVHKHDATPHCLRLEKNRKTWKNWISKLGSCTSEEVRSKLHSFSTLESTFWVHCALDVFLFDYLLKTRSVRMRIAGRVFALYYSATA